MSRLVTAAVLAVVLHVALFSVRVPWSNPALPLPRSHSVDINLEAFTAAAEKPSAPEPAHIRPRPPEQRPKHRPQRQRQPKPEPKPLRKKVATLPVPQRTAAPEARPDPIPEASAPERAEPLMDQAAEKGVSGPAPSQASGSAPSETEHAAIQVSRPRYDINPPPRYPRAARRRNYQGTVILAVRVTTDGRAAEVKVAESSGHAVLDESALKAVRQWLFTPARRGTRPVETWVEVPVRFELR